MNTKPSLPSRLTDWFRKNTQGLLLYQWVSYFMIFTVLVIFILAYPAQESPGWRFYGTILLLAALLVINILWFQWEKLLSPGKTLFFAWAFNILSALLVLAAFAFTGRGEIIFLIFMLSAQFAVMFGVWPAGGLYTFIILGISIGILKAYGLSNDQLVQAGTQFATGMIFILLVILLESRSRQATERAEGLLKDLQAANAALKAAHQREKELAIAEERVRLARDIHDGVGHHLTVLSIQLQAAGKLVEHNPQAAAESIQVSRAEAQAALEEIRRSVGVMRQPLAESRPLAGVLSDLAREFSEHSGMPVHFEQAGEPVELSLFAQQTLYRVVQESLTNSQKHGKDVRNIQVKLVYSTGTVRLVVSDDGLKPEASASRAGYGLKGLQERVEQLGGKFCCGPGQTNGFQVDVTIPLQEAGHDPGSAG